VNVPGKSENYWKWIATTGALFTLAIVTTGAGWFYDTRDQPSKSQITEMRSELSTVHERQTETLIRLAVIEQELMALEQELQRHEENSPQR
jgi:hypothetical protein